MYCRSGAASDCPTLTAKQIVLVTAKKSVLGNLICIAMKLHQCATGVLCIRYWNYYFLFVTNCGMHFTSLGALRVTHHHQICHSHLCYVNPQVTLVTALELCLDISACSRGSATENLSLPSIFKQTLSTRYIQTVQPCLSILPCNTTPVVHNMEVQKA